MTRCKQACKMLSGFVQSRLYISLFNPSPWWSPRLGQRHRRRLEPWFLRLRWVLLSPTNDIYCSGSGFSPSWPYAYHGRLEGIEGVWKPNCGYARTKCWASMRVIESVQPMHTKKKEYPRKLGTSHFDHIKEQNPCRLPGHWQRPFNPNNFLFFFRTLIRMMALLESSALRSDRW